MTISCVQQRRPWHLRKVIPPALVSCSLLNDRYQFKLTWFVLLQKRKPFSRTSRSSKSKWLTRGPSSSSVRSRTGSTTTSSQSFPKSLAVASLVSVSLLIISLISMADGIIEWALQIRLGRNGTTRSTSGIIILWRRGSRWKPTSRTTSLSRLASITRTSTARP